MNLIKVFNGCSFIGKFNDVPFFEGFNTVQYLQSVTGCYQGYLVCETTGGQGLSNIEKCATCAQGILCMTHFTYPSLGSNKI